MINENRRTFLKGAAFTVAGATLATGVFETVAEASKEVAAEFTNTPERLDFYPPLEEWDSFRELDGDDWKRGGIARKGVASQDNPDGIQVTTTRSFHVSAPTVKRAAV